MSEHKVPAWLEAKIDQRMAELRLAAAFTQAFAPNVTMIMSPLVEPAEDTKLGLEYWERCCDNCGKYCREGEPFHTGHVVRELPGGRPVTLMFGVCGNCAQTFGSEGTP